jgi:hypothetical protein
MINTIFEPDRSVASLTLAELENLIKDIVEKYQKSQQKQPKLIEFSKEANFDENHRPLWEIVVESASTIPDEDWAKVPEDASERLDYYLYKNS